MEEIRDRYQHLTCVGDPAAGILKYEDSKLKWTANLPVGGSVTIERRGTVTTIKRSDSTHFKIERESHTA